MPDKQTFSERANALASKASFAALVVAPIGQREFELLYLHASDAEFCKETCRDFSARGWEPVLFLAWTSQGLKMEHTEKLLEWPVGLLPDFVRTVCMAFIASVNQMQPADRAKAN